MMPAKENKTFSSEFYGANISSMFSGTAPDGTRWAPISQLKKARTKENKTIYMLFSCPLKY